MSTVITQEEANSEMDRAMQPTSAIPAIQQQAMEDITTIGTGESREKRKNFSKASELLSSSSSCFYIHITKICRSPRYLLQGFKTRRSTISSILHLFSKNCETLL